ncbi:Glycosyl transferases group 1 [Salinimicrobium catena]|uniref:Glycosyl transferases group 1 n=1 Tax=Salinimicrobium catena TaxID=390640 RepID=A0A1H5LU16_9FLAO|nr:glycosyltransferase family 4 protein [Salinimicrobium catena]SDL14364.1 Glycosyl transferases group 1 [Salinimicrobium catena]SEE80474.1 Glycosyl transferases group 1 [Salinimicrobium catena]
MKKLLVIGYVWPEPDSSAAGRRMLQLLDLFLEQDYEITFATTAAETEVMTDLSALGIATEKIRLNHPSFDDFLAEMDPEIILFDRFMMEEQFGWRVAEVCPDAIRILDTEDLHFLRNARQEAAKRNLELNSKMLQSDLAKREIASIYRCDLSLIISEAEMDLLQMEFGISEKLLFYLPFLETELSEEEKKKLPDFEARRNFISIGNFRHQPNWDAVLNLKQNIWPLIRKELPQAEIHIYGAYPAQKVTQLHNEREGFIVKGWAASASEVIQSARVLLAPLRFGAGLKGKFIDAMKNGTPAVSTSVGIEGMTGDLSWMGKIANEPEAFAQASVKLYTNRELWEKGQRNGFELLEKRFSKKSFSEAFLHRLIELKAKLVEHRQNNFTGAMLTHHQTASTKFMSRYIELKNKLEELNKKRPI